MQRFGAVAGKCHLRECQADWMRGNLLANIIWFSRAEWSGRDVVGSYGCSTSWILYEPCDTKLAAMNAVPFKTAPYSFVDFAWQIRVWCALWITRLRAQIPGTSNSRTQQATPRELSLDRS